MKNLVATNDIDRNETIYINPLHILYIRGEIVPKEICLTNGKIIRTDDDVDNFIYEITAESGQNRDKK